MSIRSALEIFGTRLGLAVVPRLPRRVVTGMARFFGSAAYCLSAHLRHVGMANLDIAFGQTRSRAEKRCILRSSFRTFALVVLDLFWFARNTGERVREFVRLGSDYRVLLRDEPYLCLTGHFGNWELLGQAVQLSGVPVVSVAAPLANPDVDVLFNRIRSKTGQTVVMKQGAVRKLLQTLKRNGKIAILLDQNTKPSEGGVFVDFFGLPVPVSNAVAMLHMHTGAEIRFGVCLPQPDGTYLAADFRTIEIPASDTADKAGRSAAITRTIAGFIEEQVRARPQYWLWMYKRWKYVGPGRTRSEYPFYAKELQDVDKRALS